MSSKYSYVHEFNCKNCKKLHITKSKQKQPPKYCSHKCATESTKVSIETKWQRAIIAFEKDVIKQEGCWGWKGMITNKGYAQISGKYSSRKAHRISYEIHKGLIPQDMHILHSCRNKQCTNPEHLRLGTNQENMDDRTKDDTQASILKIDDVKDIKLLLKNGKLSHNEIAKKYNVGRECISKINQGIRWKHVKI